MILCAAGVSGYAHADISKTLSGFCELVEKNDKGQLRNKMRIVTSNYRLSLKDYYAGVSCKTGHPGMRPLGLLCTFFGP